MSVVRENQKTAINMAHQEVAGQIWISSGLDAKLLGLLGFMAAAAGVLLTVSHGLASDRWVLLIGAGGAIVFILIDTVSNNDLDSLSALKFYEDFGGNTAETFDAQLIADIGDLIEKNEKKLDDRRGYLAIAFTWPVLSAVAFGLVRLFA